MRLTHSLPIATLAFLFSLCGPHFVSGADQIVGSGNVVSEPRAVAGFTAVVLKGTGQLQIKQGKTESLTITADDNILPELTSDVDGGKLILSVKPNRNIRPSKGITYTVEVKKLHGIELSGSGGAKASKIDTDNLSVVVSGSGNITVAGSAARQRIQITGAGNYEGLELQSNTAEVTISGSGKVHLAVSDELKALISGSGAIQYSGNPRVSQRVTGSGSIQQR